MFEQALFNHMVNFMFDSTVIPVYFGDASSNQDQPYIVMWVLDSDGDPRTLCDSQFDAGDSFIQFNVYANDAKTSFGIKQELNLFLTSFRSLTLGAVSYTISRTTHGASPSSTLLTNGLALDVLAKTFNYEKVN